MQTQSEDEEPKMRTQTTIFVEGDLTIELEKTKTCLTIKPGEWGLYNGAVRLFFKDEKATRAFVGKLIEAVGK